MNAQADIIENVKKKKVFSKEEEIGKKKKKSRKRRSLQIKSVHSNHLPEEENPNEQRLHRWKMERKKMLAPSASCSVSVVRLRSLRLNIQF